MSTPTESSPDDQRTVLCRLSGPDADQLREFLEDSRAESACRPVARRTGEGVETVVLLTGEQVDAARSSRGAVTVEVLEDLTEQSAERRSQVGDGNRYAARGAVPRGLGRKE